MHQQPTRTFFPKSLSGLYNTKEKEKLKPHVHESFEIYYHVSGGDKFYIDNKVYDILPHDLFILPPENVHVCTTRDGETYERYLLFVHPKILKPMYDNHTDIVSILENSCKSSSHKVHLTEEQHKRYIDLHDKFISITGYGEDMLKYIASIEILLFICELLEKNKDSFCSNSDEESSISKIIHFIEKNLTNDLSLGSIAEALGMKERTISKTFKTITNTTVYDYILNCRIAEAKKLLLEGVPVTQVCEMVGFNNYGHFRKIFKKIVGIPPKQYVVNL